MFNFKLIELGSAAIVATACFTATTAKAQHNQISSLVGGDVILPVSSIRESRLSGTLLQKYDFSCGSAAVATLLTHHYGYPVTESAIFESMYSQGDQNKIKREGFSLLDLKRGLAAHGFEADGFVQPLEKLAQARLPAIVLINENGYMHFVVLKGLKDQRVLIGDPANGTRAISRSAFNAIWPSGLLLVVHNRVKSARFNLASDWRAAPQALLADGVHRGSLTNVTLPKNGPGDF
ncbi:MAG: C39 family peptidase [Polaromonas sp.]|jgi:predicted double-glycine peptidase|nr:C39 family peptidase [Polaromonas sp.]